MLLNACKYVKTFLNCSCMVGEGSHLHSVAFQSIAVESSGRRMLLH